jgi:hypothetical protein
MNSPALRTPSHSPNIHAKLALVFRSSQSASSDPFDSKLLMTEFQIFSSVFLIPILKIDAGSLSLLPWFWFRQFQFVTRFQSSDSSSACHYISSKNSLDFGVDPQPRMLPTDSKGDSFRLRSAVDLHLPASLRRIVERWRTRNCAPSRVDARPRVNLLLKIEHITLIQAEGTFQCPLWHIILIQGHHKDHSISSIIIKIVFY